MFRLVGLLLLALAVGALPARLTAGESDRAKPQPDLPKLFRLADANKDGKLSRAEFRRLLRNTTRFKDNPQALDKLFTYLDGDGNGFLSRAEFRKLGTLMAQGKKADDKPAAKKQPERPATADGVAFFEK